MGESTWLIEPDEIVKVNLDTTSWRLASKILKIVKNAIRDIREDDSTLILLDINSSSILTKKTIEELESLMDSPRLKLKFSTSYNLSEGDNLLFLYKALQHFNTEFVSSSMIRNNMKLLKGTYVPLSNYLIDATAFKNLLKYNKDNLDWVFGFIARFKLEVIDDFSKHQVSIIFDNEEYIIQYNTEINSDGNKILKISDLFKR